MSRTRTFVLFCLPFQIFFPLLWRARSRAMGARLSERLGMFTKHFLLLLSTVSQVFVCGSDARISIGNRVERACVLKGQLRQFFKVSWSPWDLLDTFSGTLRSFVHDYRLKRCAHCLQFSFYRLPQTVHLAFYNYWRHCVLMSLLAKR